MARPVLVFRYWGRFGHFLRAEASASALSYPIPPRTVLLGVIGAVLGLEKDEPQVQLSEAQIAVSGKLPRTHWHRAKLRKELPTPLDLKTKAGAKGSDKPENPTLIYQEWLLEPDYQVYAALPEPYHDELARRLRERRWHYPPSLGLSEMTADLELIAEGQGEPLGPGQSVACATLARQDQVSFDGLVALQTQTSLTVSVQRLPYAVTPDRVFTHANYLFEREARPIPLRSDHAWRVGWGSEQRDVVFL